MLLPLGGRDADHEVETDADARIVRSHERAAADRGVWQLAGPRFLWTTYGRLASPSLAKQEIAGYGRVGGDRSYEPFASRVPPACGSALRLTSW